MWYDTKVDGEPENNFEMFIQVGTDLQPARELIIEKYGVECAITLKDQRYIKVNIKEEQPGQLEHILRDFFGAAGTPAIIPCLPAIKTMNYLLKDYGKQLQGHLVVDQPGDSSV